jgi:class 3 adenylate cyclase/tetratricopeptide (TPR) repeat protein
MICPGCKFENPEGAKFCNQCGNPLELLCPGCGKVNPLGSRFCNECGLRFEEISETEKTAPETEAERKYVTVLFSDLSGYTAMSENLDPEELKEITTPIFDQISKVISKYEGFVEKFVGDAVMALFGVPKAHEDDPIRAIRAAREIHDLVDALSPEMENRIGQPIAMHTGINTGLVVTGEVDMEKGTHGVAGDTINLASRLSGLAKSGEILVGPDTCRPAEGHFTFERLEPTTVKGKAEPIQVHKVLSAKERPITIHRLSGIRADLIGRKAEIAQLGEAVEQLRGGKGRIFSICGDAGTGKSRLVEEFKSTLDLEEIQWLEGHAYAYSQNIPYFPMIDLLNRTFQIEEGDPPEKVRERIESGIEDLIGKKEDVVPYVGGLYALSYPEAEDVSPEFWKSRLQDAIQVILSALAGRAPTIYYLEDLHWADPSFVELLRNALLQIRQPAIVLCVYRPVFNLFTSHQVSGVGNAYQEVRLQDLSLTEAQNMLESLLETETIPSDLKRFVQNKAEGNPFYLEELVNSLIESGTLIRDNGGWKIAGPIRESDISPTIHGLISGRLDRLEKETKRILQEASVIGRAFLYEILKRTTELRGSIDHGLSSLERLDLIRTRSVQPDLEYMFKHPLTQEVVYNGLLKKDRQAIHEQIALVMEQLFRDRLPEFYETLAFHFKQGQSIHKAVDYLIKSGEKSLKRYAVEESHQYYREAFELLAGKRERTKEEEELLIDLLIEWSYVFYYLGAFKELVDLLRSHKALAESLDDKARLGMFFAWLGFALDCRERFRDAHQYLSRALKIGEEIRNEQVIGYACTWLCWTCAEMGLLDKAITYGERAHESSRSLPGDQYLYFKSLGGLGYAHYQRGERKKAFEAGRSILEYGQNHRNVRSLFMGHWIEGFSHVANGDLQSAIECCTKALQLSVDPFYSHGARILLGAIHTLSGNLQEAEESLQEIVSFSEEFGCERVGTPAQMFLGAVTVAKGNMSQGLKMLEETRRVFLENERRRFYAQTEYVLGRVYLQIVEGSRQVNLSSMAKNIGFLVKKVPFASQKAEAHFGKAIEVAKEIGAKGMQGQAYLDLGLLHKTKKRVHRARDCISEAIQLLEECEAEVILKQAKKALASLA